MNNYKFYINKYSYVKSDEPDTSFIPMLIRRKLNAFGKSALYTMYNSYEENTEYKLIFASEYGDVERVSKLIEQRIETGEVSPTGFGLSVHNATVGLFSLLKKIKTSYNSISAGNNTIQNAIADTILQSINSPVLFCYAEAVNGIKSVSFSISNKKSGFEAEFIKFDTPPKNIPDNFDALIDFLDGKTNEYKTNLYMLKRI